MPDEPPRDPPEDDGRPPFARGYPRTAALDELVRALRSGNYRRVRELTPRTLERAESPEEKKAILDLRRRIDPDPIALYLFGLTLALLVFLSVWFYAHGH